MAALARAWSIVFIAATAVLADSGPVVDSPWARATAPSASTGAVYFALQGGASDDRLLSATTVAAERAELHTHTMADGMMQMRQVSAVPVPAGTTVEFKPGGLHVMLFGLKAPLTAGASFELVLHFEKGGRQAVGVSVRGVGATGAETLPPGKAHEHRH